MDAAGASATTAIVVRSATAADAEACRQIGYEGFKTFNERHGFPTNHPSVEAATACVRALLRHPAVHGVVAAERDGGRVLGFNFLSERDPVCAVGPIVVDPMAQGRGLGRRLMRAALHRAAAARDRRSAELGRRIEGRKPVPAHVVAEARRLAPGRSLRRIASALAEQGHIAPGGKPYGAGSIAAMLRSAT